MDNYEETIDDLIYCLNMKNIKLAKVTADNILIDVALNTKLSRDQRLFLVGIYNKILFRHNF